jgi:hypothetical protein
MSEHLPSNTLWCGRSHLSRCVLTVFKRVVVCTGQWFVNTLVPDHMDNIWEMGSARMKFGQTARVEPEGTLVRRQTARVEPEGTLVRGTPGTNEVTAKTTTTAIHKRLTVWLRESLGFADNAVHLATGIEVLVFVIFALCLFGLLYFRATFLPLVNETNVVSMDRKTSPASVDLATVCYKAITVLQGRHTLEWVPWPFRGEVLTYVDMCSAHVKGPGTVEDFPYWARYHAVCGQDKGLYDRSFQNPGGWTKKAITSLRTSASVNMDSVLRSESDCVEQSKHVQQYVYDNIDTLVRKGVSNTLHAKAADEVADVFMRRFNDEMSTKGVMSAWMKDTHVYTTEFKDALRTCVAMIHRMDAGQSVLDDRWGKFYALTVAFVGSVTVSVLAAPGLVASMLPTLALTTGGQLPQITQLIAKVVCAIGVWQYAVITLRKTLEAFYNNTVPIAFVMTILFLGTLFHVRTTKLEDLRAKRSGGM